MVHSINATIAIQGLYYQEPNRIADICDAVTSYIMSIPGLIPPANSEYHSSADDSKKYISLTLNEFKQLLDSDLDDETLYALLS
jgi:hypothetical protein